MPAEIVATAGEDRVEPTVVEVQGDEDGRVDAAVNVESCRLGRVQQDRAQALGDLSARG